MSGRSQTGRDNNLVTIAHGRQKLGLHPAFGGSIAFWLSGDDHILRPTSPEALANGEILNAASFPLVPFSNRIAGSRFRWLDKEIALPVNHPVTNHSLHGIGFQSAWDVITAEGNRVSLQLTHKQDHRWPWSFHSEQTFLLDDSGFHWSIRLRNDSDEAMPAGLGFHPYFAGQDARLQFDAERVWTSGSDRIPIAAEPNIGENAFNTAKSIAGHDIDHCYDGWDGVASIDWPDSGRRLMLSSSARNVVLFIPPGGDSFCFEPVNHVSNAVNIASDDVIMPVLAPGETSQLTVAMAIA